MSGDGNSSRAGRVATVATLLVSLALFLTALLGIASLDPGAQAAPQTAPQVAPGRSISFEHLRAGDCPWSNGSVSKPTRSVSAS
jgi:hypothetical protein